MGLDTLPGFSGSQKAHLKGSHPLGKNKVGTHTGKGDQRSPFSPSMAPRFLRFWKPKGTYWEPKGTWEPVVWTPREDKTRKKSKKENLPG